MVAELLARIQCDDKHAALLGPGLGKNFRLKFEGETNQAGRRVKKLLASLRQSNGKWEEITIDTPSGDKEKLYLGPDRSANDMSCAFRAKLLGEAISELNQGMDVHTNRRSGVVSSNWKTLASLRVQSGYEAIEWEADIAAANAVDTTKVEALFAEKLQARQKRG